MLFDACPRVCRVEIDGERVTLPLVALLYLASHRPTGTRNYSKGCARLLKSEWWNQRDDVVWPRSAGR